MGHLCSPASDSPSPLWFLGPSASEQLSEPRLAQDSCGQGQQAAGVGWVCVHLHLSAILPRPKLTQGYDL